MLKIPTKITIEESPIHGFGVFATDIIERNEVIEECHLIITESDPNMMLPWQKDYGFAYPIKMGTESVIPLGYGAIYNHSDDNNAFWRHHPAYKAFQFVALRQIKIGEEIMTYYGKSYSGILKS